jgi:hypothetical protein
MNALRAPLTALPTQRKKCVYFLLDMADDFIDGFAPSNRRASAVDDKTPEIERWGPHVVGLSLPRLAGLALGAGHGSARDGGGLASCRLSPCSGPGRCAAANRDGRSFRARPET